MFFITGMSTYISVIKLMFTVTINRLFCCVVILVKYKSVVSNIAQDSERFRTIRHSSTFIDKTLLLKEIVKHDFVHIAAPDKFGKTTNLLMIKLFFGNDRQKKEVASYFRGTKIWEYKSFVIKHMCNYPTIYCRFTFSDNVTHRKDIVKELKFSLHNSFLEHKYLLNSSRISNSSKTQFEKYCNLEEKEFETGLNFLSTLLYIHYNKKVTILIDDFDSYLTKTVFKRELDPGVVSGILFRILDNTVNLNDCLERSILMSSVSYKLGTQYSGPDLLKTFKFLEVEELVPFFGFTRNETYELLDRFNFSDMSTNVTAWYGGYRSLHSNFQVYNPWSVMKFIKYKTFDISWVPKPMRKILCRYLKPHYLFRETVIPKLLKHENLTIERIETLTSYEVESLKEFDTDSNTVPDEISEYHLLLQFFLESGYLTFAQKYVKVPVQIRVKLPNKEVEKVFKLILEHLTATYYDSYTE